MILYPPPKKSLWPKILILVFFFLVVIINLAFLVKPENFYHLSFGDFQVGSYRNGLGVFENHRFHNFYNLSPYNDYLITAGKKINLLSVKDNQEELKIKFSPSWYDVTTEIFKNYFFSPAINYSVQNNQVKLNYQAQKSHNRCVTFTKNISLKETKDLEKIGTTFSFNSTDFVFSPSTFQLYSDNSQKDIAVFTDVYQQTFFSSQVSSTPASINKSVVALKSLDNSGFLLFQAESSEKLIIDQLNRLIILETPFSQNSSSVSFAICSISTLEELKEMELL